MTTRDPNAKPMTPREYEQAALKHMGSILGLDTEPAESNDALAELTRPDPEQEALLDRIAVARGPSWMTPEERIARARAYREAMARGGGR